MYYKLNRWFVMVCLMFMGQAAFSQKDRSGPVVTLHSDSYQVGDKWFCPLCRKQVDNGDRAKMDAKLCLSEWHDVMIDPQYFHDKIRYITDEELAASLQIKGLSAQEKDPGFLVDYFSNRRDNGRLSLYDPQNKKYFTTIDEFRRDVLADTFRYNRIMRSAHAFYSAEKGFALYNVSWGQKIDFNHSYPQASKWGVHYLSFIDDQMNKYMITHDAEIVRTFENLFNQWYDQLDSVKDEHAVNHTKTYDVIWYELGLANRTQRLIDAHRLFARQLSTETNKRLLKIILGSSRWLDQCLLKTPFHPYNWQTHTAFTLSYAALVYPEFRESAAWLERSKKNMILHLHSDIMDDGGYVERTPGYAEYMYSIFYRYMLLFKYFKNDDSLMKQYLPRIEKYIEFFVLTNAPVGVNVPFNDAHRNKSLVRVFREMGEFFKRGDFIGAVKTEFSPETLAALSLKPEAPKIKSIDFPDSKFAVMRDSWEPQSYFMIINYGEFRNHCHYDQLDFEIYANGVPIALDAGIGKLGYVDSLHVSWYKNPLSHNMITINQAIPEKMDKPGYDKIWCAQKRTEYFAATHDGYVHYQNTRHRRHIVYSKSRYWLIVDEIFTKEKDKDIDFNLHTPCSMIEIDQGYISKQDNGFLIICDAGDAANLNRIKSKGWADLGELAGEHGHREIDWLIFRKQSRGEKQADRMATLIYPFAAKKDIDPAAVRVERIELQDPAAIGYNVRIGDRQDIIILSDGQYRNLTDTISGDFQFAFLSYLNDKRDYAGFTQVGKFKIAHEKKSFGRKQDYEY